MRHLYTILAATVVLLASCSSSRKASQTTDDIYYSPGSGRGNVRPDADEYTETAGRGDYYSTASSDNYVRLKSQDQARWSYFDDYDSYDSYYSASYSPYYASGFGSPYYGYGYGYGSGLSISFGDPYFMWNSYFLWNSWYNPYFYNPCYGGGLLVVSKSATSSVYTHLRTFNGASYREGMTTRITNANNRSYRPAASSYYNPGTRSGNGRFVNGNSNNSNNDYYRSGNSNNYRPSSNNNSFNNSNNSFSRPSSSSSTPVRSYTPAPSSGGGGGGFSRPGRH